MKSAIAIAAILIAGCTAGETAKPTPTEPTVAATTTTTAPPETTTTVVITAPPTTVSYNEDEAYVQFVKDETNLEWEYTDYEILQFGYGFCDLLDQGYSADEIFTAMAELRVAQGFTETFMMDVAAAFGSAVPSFCPQYMWMFN